MLHIIINFLIGVYYTLNIYETYTYAVYEQ